MPDDIFADPRLAAIYDDLDGARDDLDFYVSAIALAGTSGPSSRSRRRPSMRSR